MNYTELHMHTHYSLLDGLNTQEEYMKRAKELGMTHLAITDHGTLSGHREFQRQAKAAGITPILGCEMYISATDRFDRRAIKKRDDNTQVYNHLIVLAQNETGYHNLNKLSEIAWTEGFYNKPRIDLEVLEEYQEGLIITSACRGGLIAKAIENGQPHLADNYTREFKGIFGDRFFIELQHHNPKEINDGLIALARTHGVRPVVTSDCHYARPDDLWLEQALLIVSANPKPGKEFSFSKSQKMEVLERFNYAYPDRAMNFEEFDLFLHGVEDHFAGQMVEDYGREFVKECMDNTMVVAGMIEEYPYYEGLDLLPRPKTDDPAALLDKKAWAGLRRLGKDRDTVYVDRLREELEIIKSKEFSPYFLIEANAVQWAKNQGIRIGPGRGSGAGSLVNYALGITQVDPIKHNLLFFRFINPDRNDYPDIDTDVEDKRRAELKDYLVRQYKHVASIATFGTFQGKKSVRDAARAFRVPLADVNRALKGADWMPPLDWWHEWERTDRAKEFIAKYPEVIKVAKYFYGRIREQGVHAGGIIMSKEPINRYAPMQTATISGDESKTRIPVVAVDMEEAEKIGFIKYDWLGLKALSIITDTLRLIKERHGIDIDLDNMEFDDKRVYRTLSQGWTKGVFQCEATPYTNLLVQMGGVSSFDDLVASNALVRPGAMKSTAGARFIARNKNEEMVEYHHPLMVDFTRETYGVVIYQEQVMLTMTELAGMSMSDADRVRKIIGKKKDVSEFDAYKSKFIDGASQHINPMLAEQLWHDFEAHAGYSFNKSHAVAYSMISYWTAWLKEYYPLEFMVSVLSNEKDKDQLLDYLTEVKRLGIRVKLPHVNESAEKFEIQSDERGDFIRFGLSNIKFISNKGAIRLIEKRPFKTYQELYDLTKTTGSGLNTRILQALNAIGGATFPDNPRHGNERENFFEYLNIPAFETKEVPVKVRLGFTTLDEYSDTETFVCMGMVRKVKTGEGWARIDIVDETGNAGIFDKEHTTIEAGRLYILLVSENRVARYIAVDEFDPDLSEPFTEYLVADSFPDVPEGMLRVVAFNSRVTKAGKKMATVVFSDEHKNLTSALVWPSYFVQAFAKLRPGQVVDVQLGKTKEGTLFVDKVL